MKNMYWRFDLGQIPESGWYLFTLEIEGERVVVYRYYNREHPSINEYKDKVKAWMPEPEPFVER